MQRYGTVVMDYIHLSAFESSGDVASNVYSDVERDNRVVTDLARRTGEIEAGTKPSGYGSEWGSATSALGNANDAPTIVSTQKLVRRCDRKRFRVNQ
jgi:hypothetical protein